MNNISFLFCIIYNVLVVFVVIPCLFTSWPLFVEQGSYKRDQSGVMVHIHHFHHMLLRGCMWCVLRAASPAPASPAPAHAVRVV